MNMTSATAKARDVKTLHIDDSRVTVVVLCCGRVPIFHLVAEPRGYLLTMRLFTGQGSEVQEVSL